MMKLSLSPRGGIQYGMNRQEPLSMFSRSISRGMNPGAMFHPHSSIMHKAPGGMVNTQVMPQRIPSPTPMPLGTPMQVPALGAPMSGAGALGQPGIAPGAPPAPQTSGIMPRPGMMPMGPRPGMPMGLPGQNPMMRNPMPMPGNRFAMADGGSVTDMILGALGGGLSGGSKGAISGALLSALGLGAGKGSQSGGSILEDYLPRMMAMAAMMYINKNEPPPLPGNITAGMPKTSYNRTPNAMPGGTDADYTYGSRPSVDFYGGNQTPEVQGQARGGAISGIDDADPASGSRYMGSSAPGGGVDDTIPARLSNNEYVLDSQTMSMLGDGNPDEGARKIDKFRQNIRKHKGRALAKGRMAPDAKEPEEYLP